MPNSFPCFQCQPALITLPTITMEDAYYSSAHFIINIIRAGLSRYWHLKLTFLFITQRYYERTRKLITHRTVNVVLNTLRTKKNNRVHTWWWLAFTQDESTNLSYLEGRDREADEVGQHFSCAERGGSAYYPNGSSSKSGRYKWRAEALSQAIATRPFIISIPCRTIR